MKKESDKNIAEMSWNEPGGSGDKDPWSNRPSDQGPPDLDEIFARWRDRLRGLLGGGGGDGGSQREGSSGTGGFFFLFILIAGAWFFYDSTYIVDQAERGVVLRFGKYVDTLQPGLNVRWPRPVENVYLVNVEEIRTVAIGNTKAESLMLTQDENIIDIKFTVQYQVKNARDYLFNVTAPDLTLVQATESAVREIVGRSTMDHVITEGRDVVAAKAQELIQVILDDYGTGLYVTRVNMQDAQAPDEVQDAFADAVKAREDEQRFKNEAEAYAKDVVGRVQGVAKRIVLEADAYRERVIESSKGEADRFLKLLAEYEKAPAVTRERLYIEAMEEVLSNSSKIMVDSKGSNNLLYLPFDKLLQQQTGVSSTTRSPSTSTVIPGDVTSKDDAAPSSTRDLLRSRGGR